MGNLLIIVLINVDLDMKRVSLRWKERNFADCSNSDYYFTTDGNGILR